MIASAVQPEMLHTSAGDFPLHEYRLGLGGRQWSILHTNTVLTHVDEEEVIGAMREVLPYGVSLWPSAIALAHELVARADDFRGKRVLELGAGTGLPGIVAASLGAHVVQTDKAELAMDVCKRNGERNGVRGIEHRLVDWTDWKDEAFDWIIGADILYGVTFHPHLRRIFDGGLARGGRMLISDPFRSISLRVLEPMEADGWKITVTKWSIGEEKHLRPVGVFDLEPPR
jgi:predicted nicotinamide N-methyase